MVIASNRSNGRSYRRKAARSVAQGHERFGGGLDIDDSGQDRRANSRKDEPVDTVHKAAVAGNKAARILHVMPALEGRFHEVAGLRDYGQEDSQREKAK